jgi:hypothetical protein
MAMSELQHFIISLGCSVKQRKGRGIREATHICPVSTRAREYISETLHWINAHFSSPELNPMTILMG